MKKIILSGIILIFMFNVFKCKNHTQDVDVSGINVDSILDEYEYFILFKGMELPEENLLKYYGLEKLNRELSVSVYKNGEQHIIKLPSNLELYLNYNLSAQIKEERSGQYDIVFYAKNIKNDSLSYYLLYDSPLVRGYPEQQYLGVFNKGKINFLVNLVGIIDNSFSNASVFLEKRLINKNFNEYISDLKFDTTIVTNTAKYHTKDLIIPAFKE